MEKITSFSGEYAFLSNFFPTKIEYQGITYPSSEHMYMAMKTEDQAVRQEIASIETPGKAKRFGQTIQLRDNWNSMRIKMMYLCVEQKFLQNFDLRCRLIATKDAELIEGNNWGDTFWGVCDGVGENHLGIVLMNTRWAFYAMEL